MSNLTQKKIKNWLNSGEYNNDISTLLTKIMQDSLSSNSESTTASIFEINLYYLIRKKTDIELNFIKEKNVDGNNDAQHKFLTNRGRLDAVVNNLIIEYKHHSKFNSMKKQSKAINQVEKYLNTLKENDNIEYSAILTDGIKICYFDFTDGIVRNTSISAIDSKSIDKIIRAVLNNQTKKFVPENILHDFYIDATIPSVSKSIATILYNKLIDNPTAKTLMLFEEWQSLMHLSVDDNGKSNDIRKRRKDLSLIFCDNINSPANEYMALYSLQTTYAIIVKLIACKVVERLDYNDNTRSYFDLTDISSAELQIFFEKMEDGYSYRSNNILNFLEGDFFSWYSDINQWSVIFSSELINIIKVIDSYSAFSFEVTYEPIDIFKDLYMSIIPSSVRHSMGEYFTPKWLADYVVEQSLNEIANKNWSGLDPCCGSGIFIISMIKKIVGNKEIHKIEDAEKQLIKDNILNSVYGIDINPLSVLSARVGYYLALQPFGNLRNIEIPIYLGDSAIIPHIINIDNIRCYKYSIANSKMTFDVVLPTRFVKRSDFGSVMNELQSCVNTGEAEILYDSIVDKFSTEEATSKELSSKIKELSENLILLHKNHWDGIWIRIIMNFMLVARLPKFDIIIGNPPWVKWEHLPANYANKIKELCDIRHIFSGQGQFGGTQLNICALISNVTAINWLKTDGMLAFLMPDSLMSQNSYEGFRYFYMNYEKNERLYLQKLDKWEAPLRPFQAGAKTVTQDFNTYYYSSKYVDYTKGVLVNCITKNKSVSNNFVNNATSFDTIKDKLIFSKSEAVQLSKKSSAFSYKSNIYDFSLIIGPTSYLYRTGVEFTPQEVFMLTGAGESEKGKEYYRFNNMNFARSKYHVDDTPQDGWEFKTDYIYPIVTGPKMKPFGFDTSNQYCILPYNPKDTSNPINTKELRKTQSELLIYFANHRNLIEQQSEKSKQMHRGDEFYSLSKIGPYTYANHMVAAKDNGRFCASVINSVKTPWGETKMPICVKHTIIISQDISGRFIDDAEAHYISGILNSPIVFNYISNSFKSNGISLNKSNIYIPLYNKKIKEHIEIVKLAKQAEISKNNLDVILKKIDRLYITICKNKSIKSDNK